LWYERQVCGKNTWSRAGCFRVVAVAVVGDFGNGGQIILDEATFLAVKDDAQALGAVDASGINHSRLSSGRSCWNKLLRMCGCVGCEDVAFTAD
jgi:hypothetical protein